MIKCHLKKKMKSKSECPFLMYRLIVSEDFTHFDSFLLCTYKLSTVYKLAFRGFWMCSSWIKLQTKLNFKL